MPQAKCDKCRVRYVWPNKSDLVRDARCPRCLLPLRRTSSDVRLPTVQIEKPSYIGNNFLKGARCG